MIVIKKESKYKIDKAQQLKNKEKIKLHKVRGI